MIDPKNANHTGNEQFMGYIPDLMYELSQRVGFHYRIHVVEDGQYGSRQPDGSWDGMIGELQTDVSHNNLRYTELPVIHLDLTGFTYR